jgi:hypothetical protein
MGRETAEGNQMSHTPESRRRIGEASKSRWADPEYRKRMANRRPAWSDWSGKAGSATTLKCEVCSIDFVPKVKGGSNKQKYCSEKCRDKAYARRLSADPIRRGRRNEKERVRLAADPAYKESRRKAYRKYRASHPDKAKAARLRWVSKNLKHLSEYQRSRRNQNLEKHRQQQRDYWRHLREVSRRKTPGAKRNPIFVEADRLRHNKVSWGKIAIKLLPRDYRIDPDGTENKLKQGVRRLRKTKRITP